jgi:2-oxoacid:acceptor oxidoreductase delta subunit (pyruvate/2-ketoisovalerate family)
MRKPFAITLNPGSSLANHTGSWRVQRPVYVERLPPCNHTCPAGENVQRWLYHVAAGEYDIAWELLVQSNPFPAIMGRVCYHPCETKCNRAGLDQEVNIHAVERFLGDEAIRQGWRFEIGSYTGKRVLVIGAGPSGLSAAYHLARMGHHATIYEAGPAAGGMMRFGIPRYRLPRGVLDAEIARIQAMGVDIVLNRRVDDLASVMAEGGFDAVFLAVGAHIARRVTIPAGDAGRIVDALSVLRGTEKGNPPQIGRRVIVYGGGNTAIDVARTARRLGATDTLLIYRRTRERMTAHDFEVREAIEEGVRMQWLSTIRAAGENTFVVEKMRLDDSGFPQPTGEMESIEADSLILALGQDVDLSFLQNVTGLEVKDGEVEVDGMMMTGHPGVFAGGDMVPCERTVTVAAGHGRKAAVCIDAYLRNTQPAVPSEQELGSFDKLNTWYYSDAPKKVQPALDLIRRQSTFEEVAGGLDESNALFEARRCLSCGNCFECDNCYGVCPDNAVIKLDAGVRLQFNYDFCKGCGLCAEECPCGAIEMVAESAVRPGYAGENAD